MEPTLSREEEHVLINGAILLLRHPERHPQFCDMVEGWMAGLLGTRKIYKFHDALQQDPFPEKMLEDLSDFLKDWFRTISADELQQFRMSQMPQTIELGYN